jgi:hypothetical protein
VFYGSLVLLQPHIKILNNLISAIKFKEKQTMSTNKNLFKEAIADAKAVREAALVNAKEALHEALTPKLQSMLSAKLQEMESEDEMEESFKSSHSEHEGENLDFNLEEDEDGLEEDFDLSEILAELADEDEETMEEGKSSKDDEDKKSKMNEAEDEEAEDEDEESDEEAEDEEGEEEIGEMSVDDLKDLITSIVHNELEKEEEETSADEAEEESDEEAGNGVEMSDEEEIDLEELLAELDVLNENEEYEKEEKLDEISSEGIAALVGLIPGVVLTAAIIKDIVAYMKDNNLKGIEGFMKAYKVVGGAASAYMDRKVGGNEPGQGHGVDPSKTFGPQNEAEEELEEAISTIKTLRNELNETNLLNAKLLYVNKIFKAKNLTESQKLKVIASFDKATTVKEAKIVFESLNNAIATPAKKAIKESFGFASKAAGVAPNRTIVESNDVITRMQKLANIIK